LTDLKVTYARAGERGTACFKYMYVSPLSGDRKPKFENSNYHGNLKFASRVLSNWRRQIFSGGRGSAPGGKAQGTAKQASKFSPLNNF